MTAEVARTKTRLVKAPALKPPHIPPVVDESTYDESRGRIHAHKYRDGVWRYITRAELNAAYRHQPDPEAASE